MNRRARTPSTTHRLNSFTYGNGNNVVYNYDSSDRVIGVLVNGVLKTTYDYDANGSVGRVTDVTTGKSTRFIYDFANRLVRVTESNGNSVAFSYDANNNASSFIDTINGTVYTTSYTFDKDNRPTEVKSTQNNKTTYAYDGLGRLSSKAWGSGGTTYTTSYTYKNKENSTTSETSIQVASITNGTQPALTYTYDQNGNISTINNGTSVIKYEYNELNEVIRENNQIENKTIKYAYDLGGNLLSQTEYAYTESDVGTPTRVIPYVYGDTNWKDKLTSFDGKAITYDAIGNPLTYDGVSMTWVQGRQLASYIKTGLAISYVYNENGIRTSKTVNGIITNYRLSGSQVTYESNGTDSLYYTYDTQGQIVSVILNGTEYAYVKNGQNDIIGLIDSQGNQVVSYTYGTWGQPLSITGSLASTLGVKNPYRYRGYRFDTETGLYSLLTRFYDPVIGRFINADDIEILAIEQGSLIQNNLFSYCLNNPVNMIDHSGYMAEAIALSGSGFAAFAAWLSTLGGANFFNPIGWVILSILAAGAVTVAGIGLYNKYQASKPKAANLPTFKKLTIKMDHIMSGHSPKGGRNPKGNKSVFYGMTAAAVRRAIEEAYNVCEKIQTQGNNVLVRGYSKTYNIVIEMWVNIKEKIIETAYPK